MSTSRRARRRAKAHTVRALSHVSVRLMQPFERLPYTGTALDGR